MDGWIESQRKDYTYPLSFFCPFFLPRFPATPPFPVNFRAAVYLILGHYYEHVGLMLSLERKGLLDNGDYFVIGVDLEQYAASEPEKYLRGVLNNDTEQAAISAYQSYLAIIPSASQKEFVDFAKQVRNNLSTTD